MSNIAVDLRGLFTIDLSMHVNLVRRSGNKSTLETKSLVFSVIRGDDDIYIPRAYIVNFLLYVESSGKPILLMKDAPLCNIQQRLVCAET